MKINYGIKIVGSWWLIQRILVVLFILKDKFKFNLYIDKIYKFDNNLIHDFKNHKIYGKSILKI